jgi:5'-methylthioadenosine phosphorylase
MPTARVGVIGGSGLYNIKGLADVTEVSLDTPFGPPSAAITIGRLGSVSVAFLPRHGRGHRFSPTEVPYRANIHALKSLGVEHIISVNACGSLRDDYKPGDLVIPDQLIDRTRSRVSTFFERGIVAHVLFAEPFCPVLSRVLYEAAREQGGAVHRGGSYVVMEGPAFSTRAESHLYRSWGASIVGMTALPEAKLAREAEICYATISGVTDYDCWKTEEEPTPIDAIINTLQQNVNRIREIIRLAVTRLPDRSACGCSSALKTAIVTDPKMIPVDTKERLKLIIGKYLGE